MSGKKPAAKKSDRKLVSAFAKGPFVGKSPIKGRDSRFILNWKGLENGILLLWGKKPNKDEAAFWGPIFKRLKEDEEKRMELGINCIAPRKGKDGCTAMLQAPIGTKWPWEQMVCIVGEQCNTKENRCAVAKKLVKFINDNTTSATFDFVHRTRRGQDLTTDPLETLDACLLDLDVVRLMHAAFPTVPMSELSTNHEVMKTFWRNIEHGKEAIELHGESVEEEDEEDSE